MPIKWKPSSRFDPAVILKRIDSVRTVNSEGGASFSGFDLHECEPALHSMLEFPPVAGEIDLSRIVWRALTRVRGPLTPHDFLTAANSELSELLATREEQYRLLTTISIGPRDLPATLSSLGASIRFLKQGFPAKFKSRETLIQQHPTRVPPAPPTYCRVVVSLRAKSPAAAFSKAMRALDLQRAMWCLMANPAMQITFGSSSLIPINVIRLGGHHTLHRQDGSPASDGIWFEPGYVESSVFRFSKPAVVRKNCLWAFRRLAMATYKEQLISAMVRYVRAFDEADASTAFIRLWSAVESLVSPGVADYDKVIRRCAFLFADGAFHRQMLEHLREYRNESVHAGEFSDRARTFCFQLQGYFEQLVWFYVRNAAFFTSLDEANRFLDTPSDKAKIKRQMQLARKALNFLR